MTQQNPSNNGDLTVAARKFGDLGRRIDKIASSTRRRNLIVLLASLALSAFVAFNFWRAYSQMNDIGPDTVANYAESMISGYLDSSQPALEEQLVARAPDVINQLEARVRTMPNMLADQLHAVTKANIAKHMPELEAEIVGAVKTGLTAAKDKIAEMPGKTQEDKARNFLNDLGQVYGDELIRAVDLFREKYAAGAKDIIAHLDHLAVNKGLTQEEEYQREAIRKFLALADHYQSISGQTDPTHMSIQTDQANIPGTK